MSPFLSLSMHRISATWRRFRDSLRHRWRSVRCANRQYSISVLLDDPVQCRRLEHSLQAALRRLPAIPRTEYDGEIIILVQHAITTNRQVCGCTHRVRRSDGTTLWLLQLALTERGRALSVDEVLATLADRWIMLVRDAGNVPASPPTASFPAEPVPLLHGGGAVVAQVTPAATPEASEPQPHPAWQPEAFPDQQTNGMASSPMPARPPAQPDANAGEPEAKRELASPAEPHPQIHVQAPHADEQAALLAAAAALWAGGLALLPIDRCTKRPDARFLPFDRYGKRSWKPFQERRAELEVVCNWVRHGAQLAAVCGRISGGAADAGLLVLDFDIPRFYHAWRSATGRLSAGLPVQRTGGGYQVWLRCPEPGPNVKLAWEAHDPDPANPGDPGRHSAIETRGEGGYAVVAPSLHPSGRRYTVLSGDFGAVPRLTQTDAETLLEAARRLDEAPHPRQELDRLRAAFRAPTGTHPGGQEQPSVITLFNQATTCAELLERYGYRRDRQYGDYARYIRPGGEQPSVTVFAHCSKHWNSNDPLSSYNQRDLHDPFDIFCFYEHGGDRHAAVKAAAAYLGRTATARQPVA